jgi:HSP20 family protein
MKIFLIIKKENKMSLIKWNPNRSVMSPFSEWDHFLDEFFGNSVEYKRSSWTPNMDIHENMKDFTLSMDLPGLSKKEVSLNVDDSVLTIAGERSYSDKSADARRIERGYGKFNRSFSLPDNVNASEINASFKNGELIVTLPKTEETLSKSKEIKIS